MISSRTPEGDPNCCPVCGKGTSTEPSTVPLRDAPCPHCGSLLWFPNSAANAERVDLAQEMAALLAAKLRPAQYYAAFLRRLLAAIAAPAGGVWTVTAHEDWRLVKHINMHKIGLRRGERRQEMHDEPLR